MLQIETNQHRGEMINSLIRHKTPDGMISASSFEELERVFGDEVYSEALYQMTRLELAPGQAKSIWSDIVRHQADLADRLGRQVSLLTAVCDYFHQVRPILNDPILVEVRLLMQKEECAAKDELTGLFNRRSFNLELPREMERYRRFGHPFSLLMIDVDHFKRFNDLFGHPAGDQALRTLADALGRTARLCDRACRFGGEEFAVILPQSTREEAIVAAERIRSAVAATPVIFEGVNLGPITVSLGVATYPSDALEADELVRRADEALYQAKRTRNSVSAFKGSKRQHPRYPIDTHFRMRLPEREGESWVCRAKNISFGGILCETDAGGPEEASVEVVLKDDSRDLRLPLRATVRRMSKIEGNRFYLGLSFELPTVDEQRLLMEFIQHQSVVTH